MTDLILYHHPMSRSQTMVWLMEELDVPYKRRSVDIFKGGDPEYRAKVPTGKVPAVEVDGQVLTETSAIALYLADRFAPGRLAPALDHADRAQYVYWCVARAGLLEPAMTCHTLKVDMSEPRVRGMTGWAPFPEQIETVRAAIDGRETLLDFGFSTADILVGGFVAFGMMFDLIPKEAPFTTYVDALQSRPAYKQSREKNEAFDIVPA